MSEKGPEATKPLTNPQQPSKVPATKEGSAISAKPARPARQPNHRIPYEPNCLVCKDSGRIELEAMYAKGEPWHEMLEWMGMDFSRAMIERHMRALDLDIERVKCTYRATSAIMEKGLQRMEDGLEPVTVDHMIKLIPHIDKREGRIVEHVKVDAPRQIIINAPAGLPLPSGMTVRGVLVPPEGPQEQLMLPPMQQEKEGNE